MINCAWCGKPNARIWINMYDGGYIHKKCYFPATGNSFPKINKINNKSKSYMNKLESIDTIIVNSELKELIRKYYGSIGIQVLKQSIKISKIV